MIRAKHAPFFAYPAWKQDMQKILGVSTEARRSNRSPKSQSKDRSKPPLAVGWIAVEIFIAEQVFRKG